MATPTAVQTGSGTPPDSRLDHEDRRDERPEDDMQLDIHVPSFTWPGGAEAIGPTLTTLARTAESIGARTLSVMDHWFQMDMLWPAEEPMLEGYTALSFAAAQDGATAFPAPGGRSDLPPPRAPGQDDHHAGRPVGRSGRARTGGRMVREGASGAGCSVPTVA